MRRLIFILGFLLLLPIDASAWDMGDGRETAVIGGVNIDVFTYRPPGCPQPALLFVFHGNGRTAQRYRDYARPLADRVCLIVIAPLFDRDRFPNWRYNRGGIVSNGKVLARSEWTVTMVAELVDWGRRQEGRPDASYYLFGHSAGGQFLSRVAAFAPPPGVSRIVIANPSSYVVPSLEEPAPYGMGDVFNSADADAKLQDYLKLPITVYLGEKDTGEKDLDKRPAARRQGTRRLDRGENIFHIAQTLARDKGWAFNWKLVKVPKVGHSTKGMLTAAEVLEAFGWSNTDNEQ